MAIVGAGPCGLATAHALSKALPKGSSIGLFERAPAVSIPRGAGLQLEVNGLMALRSIDASLYEKIVEKHAVTFSSTDFKEPQVWSGCVIVHK